MMPAAQVKDSWSRRIDEASRWYAELQSDDLSAEDMDEFLAWQADPDNEAAFEEVEQALLAMDQAGVPDQGATQAQVPDMHRRKRRTASLPQKSRGLRWVPGGAVAAALLVAASVLVAQTGFGADPEIYHTAVGEQRSVALEDGTTVTLNTNSTLEVDYSKRTRAVHLVEGQALFDVSKDPERPFVVATDTSTTTALGTVFDVFEDEDQTAVTLLEGSVSVSLRAGKGGGNSGGASNDAVLLSPGERALVSAGTPPAVNAVDVEAYTKWREGVVQFTDVPLAEAVAELNRYSRIELRLQDKSLEAKRVSGSFKAGEPDVFVSTLELFMPIRTIRIGNIIYISADNRVPTPQE